VHRAWKSALVIASLFVARPALAFHAGAEYDKQPGAGGGGGLFYTGVASERGLTCPACHTNAPGKISINLNESTNSLFTSFSYEPGKTYPLTATLGGDATKIDHFNGLSVSIVDDQGNPAGTISGFGADDFYQASNGTIASAGTTKWNVTTWTFSWTAPATSVTGRVHLHVASVAGNAAGVPGLSLSDPWDDDVFVGTLDLDPTAATASLQGESHDPNRVVLAAFVRMFGSEQGYALPEGDMHRRRRRRSGRRRLQGGVVVHRVDEAG
jgi:hypothetical protein